MKRLLTLLATLAACFVALAALLAVQNAQWRAQLTQETIRLEAAALAQQRIARAEAWTATLAALYDLLWLAAALALIVCAAMSFFALVGLHQRRQLRRLTPAANGLYPLQLIAGQVVNPNLMIYPALADNTPTTIPPQIALAASASADRVALTANLADMRMTAAGAKLLAGRYDPPAPQHTLAPCAPAQLPASAPQPAAEPAAPLALNDAWQQSTANHWLLGQSTSGKPYHLDLTSAVHVGLLGATGTGKTSSTALLLALHARRHGYEVLVLDGKGGVDWSPYATTFDVQPTDYTVFGDQITAIERIHRRRMATLKANNAPTIRHLTDVSYPPLLVIVEEAGYTAQSLRMADSSQAEQVANIQSNLMRVSRASGIHFLLIDQSPQHWPGVVKANIKSWICYKLGSGQANAVNLYHAHKLPANGAFVTSDDDGETIYRSWHTAAHAAPLLRQLPASRRIINAKYTVHPPVHSPVHDAFVDPFTARSPEVDPLPTNATNATTTTNAPPTTEDGWYEWTLTEYLPTHPELLTLDAQGRGVGISVLARAMALVRYGDADQYELMKSTASAVAGRIRRTVRVDGAPLGVDRSVTG